MPWLALPGDDLAGEVLRLMGAYHRSLARVARMRAELVASGRDPVEQVRLVPGVDEWGRAMVRVAPTVLIVLDDETEPGDDGRTAGECSGKRYPGSSDAA